MFVVVVSFHVWLQILFWTIVACAAIVGLACYLNREPDSPEQVSARANARIARMLEAEKRPKLRDWRPGGWTYFWAGWLAFVVTLGVTL